MPFTIFYGDNIDFSLLSVQLQRLSSFFTGREGITLADWAAKVQSITVAQQSFFSEVCSLSRLVLVMPATNTASERSFTAMKKLKTYIRSMMVQSRHNHITLLIIYKDIADNLDLKMIGDKLVCGSKH